MSKLDSLIAGAAVPFSDGRDGYEAFLLGELNQKISEEFAEGKIFKRESTTNSQASRLKARS